MPQLFARNTRLSRRLNDRSRLQRALRSGFETLEDRRLLAVVSHWTGDATPTDSVGSNDATFFDGAGYESGQIGQAFSFDGIDDRAIIDDNPSFELTESLSIEAWVKADSYPSVGQGHGSILFRGDDRGGLDPYELSVTETGDLVFRFTSGTSGQTLSAPMPLGEFVHVAGTLDDATGDTALYINGVQMAAGNTTARPFGALDPTQNPSVGIGNHGGVPSLTPHNFPFDGLIDEVKLHDSALSAADVLATYNAGKGSLLPTLNVGYVSVVEGLAESTLVNDFIDEGSGGLNSPRGIAVAPNGDVFVGSSDPAQVLRYDANGQFVEVFADAAAGEDGRTGALGIHGGYLFVTTANNDSILRFELATGNPAPATGQPGAVFVPPGSGGLDRPFGIEFDSAGNLYVPSLEGMNVLRFDGTTGALLGEFVAAGSEGVGDRALDLDFGPDGNLYVADSREGRVLRYQGPNGTNPGQFMDVFVAPGSGGLDRITSAGMTFSPDGDLYISNRDQDEILRFDGATGGFVEALTAAVPGTLDAPKGLVFDASETLLAVSANTNSVVRSLNTSAAIVPVSLSAPSPTLVTVNYNTLDGTATGGLDYVAQNGWLTFQPGQRHKSVVVPIVDDLLSEAEEEAYLTLSQAVGANVGSTGTITIGDNDGPIDLFVDSFEVGQWNGLWESVNRFRRSSNDSTAGNYAAETDGSWWNPNSSLTIANPLDLSAYSSVELAFDWKIESNWDNGEYLRLEFWDGNSWNVIRTLDGNGPDEGSWQSVSLAIPASYLRDDFKFRFASRVNRSNEDGYVDNVRVSTSFIDDPEISVADGTISELSDADGGVWVSLSGPASVPVSVNYATTDDTAVAPSDYVALSGTLTFAPGEVSKRIIMRAWNDTEVEGSESYDLTLSSPSGNATLGTAEATVTILDDDASRQLTIDDMEVVEGSESFHFRGDFVEVGSGGLLGANSMTYGPDGNLYVVSIGSNAVLRYDGQTGEFIDSFVSRGSGGLSSPRDLVFRGNDLFVTSFGTNEVLRYDAISGAFEDVFVTAGLGGIINPDGLTFGADGNLYVAGNGSHNVVRYDGQGGNLIDEFVMPGSGGLSGPFRLTFGPDGNLYIGSSGTAEILRFSGSSGAFIDDFVSAGAGGIGSSHALEFRDGYLLVAVTGQDAVLRYDATSGDFVDELVASNSYGLHEPRAMTFDPNGNLLVGAAVGDNVHPDRIQRYGTASEAVFTLTLSTPSRVSIAVNFSTDPSGVNPATQGADYVGVTGQVVFAPGVTQRVVTVPILDDSLPELSETFQLSLSLPEGSFAGATLFDSEGVATILDDGDVGNQAPIVNAGADQTLSDNDGTGAESVTLTGSATDSEGSVVSYVWSDGTADLGPGPTLTTPLAVGVHTLTLSATDNEGAVGTDSVTITVVGNQAPTADAGADQADSDDDGSSDQVITLTGSGSDSDGIVSSVQWLNGVTVLGSTNTISPTLAVGIHTLTFTVTDNGGASTSDTVVVTIAANQAPTANAGADQTVTDNDGSGKEVVTLTGSGMDSDGNVELVQWFKDGLQIGSTASISPELDVGTHTLTFTVTDNGGALTSDTVVVTVEEPASGPNLAHDQLTSVGGTWQTVTLDSSYTSMVVIATPRYNNGSGPGVVRINNASGNSFQVRVDNAGSSAFSGGIHYIVVEEGVYDESGFKLEAVKYDEAQTSRRSGWGIDTVSYQQSYNSPVVVGQVMTANDADWSVFWASSDSRTNPPSSSTLNVGKHVAEDPDTTRATETIGYLVIEATQDGTIEGLPFVAGVGGDSIRGVDNGTYQYSYDAMPNAKTAVLSSAGMDGNDGGWAVLRGNNPVPATSGTISLSIDEDQLRDNERKHTTEQVAYFVIDPPAAIGQTIESDSSSPQGFTFHDPHDVNGDGYTSPLDVLLLVNRLNSSLGSEEGDLAVDINGDGRLSPIDPLLVINRLHDDTSLASGEQSPAAVEQAIDGYFGELDKEDEWRFPVQDLLS